MADERRRRSRRHQYADRELAAAEWDWKALDEAMFKQFSLRLAPERRASATGSVPRGSQDAIERRRDAAVRAARERSSRRR